jgi:hypothetical protein
VAKKKGPVLYELLRKDHAEKRQLSANKAPEATDASAQPQEPLPVEASAPQPPTPRMDAPQDEDDGFVFHLTKVQAAIAGGAVILALLIFAWIGCQSNKPAVPGGPPPTAGKPADGGSASTSDGEPQQPLAMLLPEAGSDPKPDAPVKVSPAAEQAASSAKPTDDAEPAGETAKPVAPSALSKTDSRKTGLNYLVIQTIPERPDAQEHAAEVRKFLASKGIRTLEVPGATGGVKILSEQGFNFDDPAEKDKLARLTDAVKKAGKEYATAKYAGRYDFRTPYPEKYKGK